MGLSVEDLAVIEGLLTGSSDGSHLANFRLRFPSLSITRCDASDVDGETPFRRYPGINLYLVDATDHCAHITLDPAHATGIVVARQRRGA